MQVICTFLKRRIQPLPVRVHGMWKYSGLQDSTRRSSEELSGEELETRVRQITNLKRDDPFVEATAAIPFIEENSLPKVTQVSTAFVYSSKTLALCAHKIFLDSGNMLS